MRNSVKFSGVVVIGLLLLLISGYFFSGKVDSQSDVNEVSSLTFEDLSKEVGNHFSPSKLEELSRQLKGKVVRWRGEVRRVSPEGVTYISVDKSPLPDVEFLASKGDRRNLQPEQKIVFTGTLEKVSIRETFPPMPNIYIYLKNARIEHNDS